MAESEEKDNATKSRIITHLNNDHHDSLVRYLEHYTHLSPLRANSAYLTTLDLSSLTLTSGSGSSKKTHHIPLTPPMASYAETRARVVAMDREARLALNRSEITVKEFLPPTGVYGVLFAIITVVFLAYSQRWWFAPGQLVEQLLGPGFARFSYVMQPWVLGVMLFMHTTEMLYFVQYKLIRHSVNPGSRLFWLWTGTTFVEGAGAFWRFNGLVRGKEEARAKKGH
ncbi:hypothetical protein LTR35_008285 [Friedmanniomyces endolithicus]|uniref:DUF2470 domain-containing protein n=1 Tax=Friedmanniomyces endolithicus TaxID=329885 RepID=A0AAN6FLH1_9PEZI|nr:hypothetical protein LTR35_008285 [Friedmanniomyces endolithicus]KAK0296303.1 hypothetical protein LTS00_005136 [Friedmanniomyces endolithicus]KAK0319644.1 hypothetical protein LTR82_009349 [Friedmanniomyces endolithicus]KAK1004937.1 hypothetical protein LTR54_007258 [Friedmanniomyces endolithicus]